MKCVSTGLPPRSCYTGGLVSMVGNDELTVNEVILGRWTVFEPTRSFFGAFKIG
jgi:TNF(Tumour Necrosis Factor) family.